MRLFLIIAFFSFSFLGFSQTNLPYNVGEYAAYKIFLVQLMLDMLNWRLKKLHP